MRTKLQELRDGCFARAMDDEPMFVLLARDASAPDKVREWAVRREQEVHDGLRPASDLADAAEAREIATSMERWRLRRDGDWRRGTLFGAEGVPTGNRHTGGVTKELGK